MRYCAKSWDIPDLLIFCSKELKLDSVLVFFSFVVLSNSWQKPFQHTKIMAAFFAHFESSNHFQRNVLSKSLNADLWLIQLQKRQKTHGMNQCLHITVLIWVFRHFSLVKSAKNPKMSVMGKMVFMHKQRFPKCSLLKMWYITAWRSYKTHRILDRWMAL